MFRSSAPNNVSGLVVCFIDDSRFRRKRRDRRTRDRTYRTNSLLWRWLVPHTRIFQHVGPLSTCTSVTVLQMLSKMICTEKLLGLIAFAKFVRVVQMLCSSVPVRRIEKLLATESAQVGCGWTGRIRVERSLNASERSTRPRMSPQMQRILMALRLIFVLEPIRAILANVLLF